MSVSAVEIERIVREVLAQLASAPEPSAPAAPACACKGASASDPADSPASGRREPAEGTAAGPNGKGLMGLTPHARQTAEGTQVRKEELVVTDRVVTLAAIADRLPGIRRVVAPVGAIVTPAVQDELLRRGVTLTYAPAAQAAPANQLRLCVAVMGAKMDPALLGRTLQTLPATVQLRSFNCVIAAVDHLSAELASGDALGLLLTQYTAAGHCLAARLPGVRPILAQDPEQAAADAALVGANVLVSNPAACGLFRVKQMAARFVQGGLRACPEVFRTRLA